MSIEEYLRGLNEEQLEFARAEACRLLEEKHHEAKRLVWTVEDGRGSREKYFAEADYLRAAECLLNLAKEVAPGWPKPMSAVRRMELRIGHLRIPESEYDEFYRAMVEKPEQQTIDPYAELKAAFAAGEAIQYCLDAFSPWVDYASSTPTWPYPPECYRVKPKEE